MALHPGDGTLPFRGPDAAAQRQQAQSVLILGPERDGGRGMGGLDGGYGRREPPFLNAAWAAASARVSRGRGLLRREAEATHPLPAALLD